jgi:allophanate hydrolase subunit 2
VFRLGRNSIGFEVKRREFGRQDRGISPKGANDQTSFITALSLLANPKTFMCFEIFTASEIVFSEHVMFTLTGAHYQTMTLNEQQIEHACVYTAEKGDVLKLTARTKGFRSYLMATKADSTRIGKKSKPYSHYFPKQFPSVRVTKAPEFDYLTEDFFKHTYRISSMSDMSGLRLEQTLQAQSYDIITSAVTDGTIQLSKDGPIVLLRHRQSTGGYPRILNVIEADMDRLAQYPYGTSVRFELVSIEMSVTLLLAHEKRLLSIQEDLA